MNSKNQTIIIDGKEYGVDQLVDCKIIARLIGLSHRTVEDMATRRELPMYKVGRSNRYKVDEILNWLNINRV
jgi:excisionase family DNA binding protein